MSKSSDGVKKWRKKIRELLVASLGGCCQICRYDRCFKALELHHIKPEEKEFSFAFLQSSCRRWELIYSEAKKCILLCANCHREVHDGTARIPKKFARFDQAIADAIRNRGNGAQESRSPSDLTPELIESFKDKQKKNSARTRFQQNSKVQKAKVQKKIMELDLLKKSILDSGIDFAKFVWVSKVAEIIDKPPQKVSAWMKKNMPSHYNSKCFKRKSSKD